MKNIAFIAVVVLLVIGTITAAIFGLIETGTQKGFSDAIIKDQERINQTLERADEFDDNLIICQSRGLRFDFATGKCVKL